MERRDRVAPSVTPAEWTRRLAGAVALVAVAFVQAPRWLSADTKLDLLVDPGSFLTRAAQLWEPLGNFGQLQNQAYGYFLPMGPFFWLGQTIGLPAWVVQRLWWSVVLLTAYSGVIALARRMGIGTEGTRILAALAFALSPRTSTELGGISVELWPSAIAPWVLVPLVGVRRGGERRAAARSALALALAGGVNAVAVGAILPLASIWLAAMPRGPVRRRLVAWWAVFVPAAIAWWLGPLIVLGRYSPPFLDWIESAAVTTSVATPANALRGASHWVGWLGGDLMTWPGGYLIATLPTLAVLSWAVVAPGLLTLGSRTTPHRAFLTASVITGVALTTMGHLGEFSPPWAPAIRDLLDGAGAALRNTHKFDVVIRLPLALGLAHAVATFRLPVPDAVRRAKLAWTSSVVRWVAVSGVVALAVPALVGQLMSRHPFVEVPPYWREAAQWLAANDDGGRALILPGSPFATSVWGDPRDEPMQALASTPWGARAVVPLSSAGNIRMLTTVEQQISTGRASPGLAAYLARAGVSRVLVRADLQTQRGRTPIPLTVRSVLSSSTGFTSVARFGPTLGANRFGGAVINSGLDVAVPALEVFQIDAAPGNEQKRAELWDTASAVRVAGGPENLLSMADAGLLTHRMVTLESEASAPLANAPLVITDGPQRREATFSAVRDVYSAPMTPTQPWQQQRPVHDWYTDPVAATAKAQVIAQYTGVSQVTASSSASAEHSPWAGIDSDPTTYWLTDPLRVELPWLQLDLPRRDRPPSTLRFLPAPGAIPRQVTVVTESGRLSTTLPPLREPALVSVPVPEGTTGWVRVEFTGITARGGQQIGVAELGLSGISPARHLALPAAKDIPAAMLLHIDRAGSDGCAYLGGRPLCGTTLASPGTERDLNRTVELPDDLGAGGAAYSVSGLARPQAGEHWDAALRPLGAAITVTASSRRSFEPAERPQAASDHSLGTAWVAGRFDLAPRLTLTWPGKRTVAAFQFQTDAALAVSRATQVRVQVGRRDLVVPVGADGWVRFPPTAASQLTVTVQRIAVQRSIEPDGTVTSLPFGVSEIMIPGLESLRRGPNESAATGAPCGYGPALVVDGRLVPTRVSGTIADLMRRRPMAVVPCPQQPVLLPAGRSEVSLRATFQWQPESLTLLAGTRGLTTVPRTGTLKILNWEPEQRTVNVTASGTERVLVVHENANAGWQAVAGATTLRPITVDGWQQGWIVPASVSGPVQLSFTPGRWYRLWLMIGTLTLLIVLACALIGARLPRRRAAASHDVVAADSAVAADSVVAADSAGESAANTGSAFDELIGVLPASAAERQGGAPRHNPGPDAATWLVALGAIAAAVMAGGLWALLGLGLGALTRLRGPRAWRIGVALSVLATLTFAAWRVSPSDAGGVTALSSAAAMVMLGVLASGLVATTRRPSARHATGPVELATPEQQPLRPSELAQNA